VTLLATPKPLSNPPLQILNYGKESQCVWMKDLVGDNSNEKALFVLAGSGGALACKARTGLVYCSMAAHFVALVQISSAYLLSVSSAKSSSSFLKRLEKVHLRKLLRLVSCWSVLLILIMQPEECFMVVWGC